MSVDTWLLLVWVACSVAWMVRTLFLLRRQERRIARLCDLMSDFTNGQCDRMIAFVDTAKVVSQELRRLRELLEPKVATPAGFQKSNDS